MSSDQIDLTPNILGLHDYHKLPSTTASSDRIYKMTTERLRTPDELNELKKGVAGSGKDECYTTILVQL